MTAALLIVLAALQAGDWWTTRTFLPLGGRERNPLVRWLIDRLGVDPALAVKSAAVMAIGAVLAAFPAPWGASFLALLCVLYAHVVWSNWRLIQRLRKNRTHDARS